MNIPFLPMHPRRPFRQWFGKKLLNKSRELVIAEKAIILSSAGKKTKYPVATLRLINNPVILSEKK